jgi:hypothetical protein
MVIAWLAALEASGLGQAARSSVWLYPAANLLHVLGAALTVGGIAVLDVLIIRGQVRVARDAASVAIPLAAGGIALQIATGIVLLSAEATASGQNPAFLLKMAVIVVGLINIAVFHARHFAFEGATARLQAGISLAVWAGALLAGRAIAYV